MQLIQQLDQFYKDFRFFERKHEYIHIPTETYMTSVTTVLKGLSEEVDWYYWKVYKVMEARYGKEAVKSHSSKGVRKGTIKFQGKNLKVETLVKNLDLKKEIDEMGFQWRNNGIVGTTRGTIIHQYMENLWNGRILKDLDYRNIQAVVKYKLTNFEMDLEELKFLGRKFYQDYREHLTPISLEQIVGCAELGVAGQIDGIFYDNRDQSYYLYDYKTDKKIDRDNFFSQFKLVTHLDDCEFNKYGLQLAIYKVLLEKYTDMKIKGSKIVWLNKDEDTYHVIDLPDLTTEAKLILKRWRQLDSI
jgi:hypothetical protein